MRKKSVGLTNDNGKSNTSTAYQRGSNRDGSPHYVFLYSDDDDNDEHDNGNDEIVDANKYYDKNIPLQLRNHKLQRDICPRKVEVVTVTLKPDDTLQALSLTYRCTVSELKRINNIHKENEIFARRVIKVPVTPFSILTEISRNNSEQETQQRETKIESTNETIGAIEINNSILDGGCKLNIESQKEIVIFPSTSNSNQHFNINNNSNNDDDINRIILNSVSIDRSKNNSTNDNYDIDHSENDELLVGERDRDSTPEARVIELFGCSGADWGLTWIHLLGASLMFGFVLPVIYYLFLTENHHNIHSRNSTRT